MRIADKDGKYQKLWILIAYLIITLPEAFRYEVGIDYGTYEKFYNIIINAGSISSIPEWFKIEYSFIGLSFISRDLINSPQLIFITYAVLTNLFIFGGIYFYRKETSMSSMTYMYACLFYLTTMNVMRQMVAVSIIFFASKFILERSFFKYMLFVMLATIFHTSAIGGIVLYFFASENNLTKKIIRVMPIVLAVIIVFFAQTLTYIVFNSGDAMSKYQSYAVINEAPIGLGFVGLMIVVMVFIINYKADTLNCSKKIQDFMVRIAPFTLVLFLLMYKMDNDGGRINFYFMIFEIVFLSLLTTAGDRKAEGLKFDYQLLPYLYAGMIFIYGLIRDGLACIPYKLWTGM
jgi:hypothetical protein